MLFTFVFLNLPLDVIAQDTARDRAKALIKAELAFQPSVFNKNEFPSCDFLKPGKMHELLGDYTFDVTFYDKNYNVVDEPSSPGRYGAVVKIKAEDGSIYTRFRTLFKSRQRLFFFFNMVEGELNFPYGMAVEPKTMSRQHHLLNDYIAFAIGRDINRSHEFAILLAGLDDIGPESDPVSQVDSALTRDRQWWLQLKRKLNGNDQRFSKEIVAPVTIDGLDAPVLRKGTCRQAGMKSDAVEKINAVLTEWSENSDQPFNACVARCGVLFFNKAYGSRNGVPITTETKHVVFSITKALSGSLLMMFVDQGLVSLDDPVETFLPEFQGADIKTSASIHHLFTHTADMEDHFTDFLSDLEHVYGEAYPYLNIGKQHKYNGSSLAIGTKILEQITGMTLPHLYKKYLFGPLGCTSIESIDASAMTWSNAYDLARIGQMLANRGAYGNQCFFSEETFEQMIPQKLDKLLGSDTKVTWGIGLTWFRGNGLSDRTIGHGSASSCTLRVDLENDLVITMTRPTAGKNFKKYHSRFIKTVTESIRN
jgi:CubicO group peptidase (beta-lactamase class C family)